MGSVFVYRWVEVSRGETVYSLLRQEYELWGKGR
jgi:hypothetical protein